MQLHLSTQAQQAATATPAACSCCCCCLITPQHIILHLLPPAASCCILLLPTEARLQPALLPPGFTEQAPLQAPGQAAMAWLQLLRVQLSVPEKQLRKRRCRQPLQGFSGGFASRYPPTSTAVLSSAGRSRVMCFAVFPLPSTAPPASGGRSRFMCFAVFLNKAPLCSPQLAAAGSHASRFP